MVWRQLPKLVPAGSIPVSCSIKPVGASNFASAGFPCIPSKSAF